MGFQTLIDARTLQDLLFSPGLTVLDCRFDLLNPEAGRQAFVTGHIPTARYADLNRDLSAPITAGSGRHPLPPPDALAARMRQFGVDLKADGATQVVTYDDANGSFAARPWWLLRWLGHTSVAVLDGGLKAWLAAGGTLESGESSPATARFAPGTATPRGDNHPTAAPKAVALSTAEVMRALGDPLTTLTDARAAERFAGTVEPIDAVAGHIPGAVNHPFTLNLDPSGRFLPAAELRQRWQQRLAGRPPENLIAMCGSGVTACHNLLSLEVAGLTGARLYAGSWSEWIRDPQRPVAKS